MRFARANLDDPELGPEALAAAGAMSVRTLNRLFGSLGATPMRWVWAERLKASRVALMQGEVRSVTDAAFAHGFSDLGHFSRSFRQHQRGARDRAGETEGILEQNGGRGSRSCVHAETRARSTLLVEPRSNPPCADNSGVMKMGLKLGKVNRGPHLPALVASSISREIAQGRLLSGDRLPTEQALAATFGVSATSCERLSPSCARKDASGRSRVGEHSLPMRPIQQCFRSTMTRFKRVTLSRACLSSVGSSRFTPLRSQPVADRRMILRACRTRSRA